MSTPERDEGPAASPGLLIATDSVQARVCANPSAMTLQGTNTWIVGQPGASDVAIVDPGPLVPAHLEAVLSAVEERRAHVALILLTHGHWDHAQGSERFAALSGAQLRGMADLQDGQRLQVGGLELQIVATPGHTSDSMSVLVESERVLLTGDTVLGQGTTVIDHPDGTLADYLGTLERIEALTSRGVVETFAPGHGPVITDAAGTIHTYREHRAQRLEAVRACVAAQPPATSRQQLADAVVGEVYGDVVPEVRSAAKQSVLAQLVYLGH